MGGANEGEGVTGRDRERAERMKERKGGEERAGTEGDRRALRGGALLGLSPTGNVFSSALSNTETTGHVAPEPLNGARATQEVSFKLHLIHLH